MKRATDVIRAGRWLDADKANRLGVSMQDVGSALATFLGGNYVNRFSLYGRSYQVIPQVPREFRQVSDWLTRYQVRTSIAIWHWLSPRRLN